MERPQGEGFDATLLAWRRANAAATLDFLDDIIQCYFASNQAFNVRYFTSANCFQQFSMYMIVANNPYSECQILLAQ